MMWIYLVLHDNEEPILLCSSKVEPGPALQAPRVSIASRASNCSSAQGQSCSPRVSLHMLAVRRTRTLLELLAKHFALRERVMKTPPHSKTSPALSKTPHSPLCSRRHRHCHHPRCRRRCRRRRRLYVYMYMYTRPHMPPSGGIYGDTPHPRGPICEKQCTCAQNQASMESFPFRKAPDP